MVNASLFELQDNLTSSVVGPGLQSVLDASLRRPDLIFKKNMYFETF